MSRRIMLTAAALALPLMLAACGGGSSSESASPTTAASSGPSALIDFVDRTFTSNAVTENGELKALSGPLTLTFTKDTVSARISCNTLVGGGTIADGVLVVDGALASTMMACDQAFMDEDTWLAQFLSSKPAVASQGAAITLTSPTIEMELTPVETVGMYDTPIHGPEALEAVQAMCDELVAKKATVDEARSTAEQAGFVLRVLVEDGVAGPATMDLNPGRLNLEVTKGIVTGCHAG